MYEIINDLADSGNELILESCRPFDNLVNNFAMGEENIAKKDEFFNYLRKLYQDKSSKTEANIADCLECISEINRMSGLNVNLRNLKNALKQSSYDNFLYAIFFDGCEMKRFPSGFEANAYPDDSLNATAADLKARIVKGLNVGKPVLFTNVCISENKGNNCELSHAVVISGFKKVCESGNPTQCRDVIKIHNSWGAGWQKQNNDGWVDADIFTQNAAKTPFASGHKNISGSVIWLDP